jgi:o-succinylbenzoate synthase
LSRIDRIVIHRRTISMKRPFVTAVRTARSIDALIVEVRDSDGRSGWGEAPTSWRVTGESVESVTAAIEGPLTDALKGYSLDESAAMSEALEQAVVRNSSARMALDCAIYDLGAQLAGLPLYQFLGGRSSEVRTDMTLSATLSESGSKQLIETALEFVASGFHTLKVKVGAGGDDVKLLNEVRRAVGADIQLRADANQGWSPSEAVKVIKSLEDAGVELEFVEQPVARDDVDGLALVAGEVETSIMADEAVWSRRDLREILRRNAADAVNIKLAKCGGVREAIEMIGLARESEIRVIMGGMAESHVGVAAAAAVASVIDRRIGRDVVAHDLDAGLLLTESPVVGGVSYRGDRVGLAASPGLGIRGLAAV